MHELEALIARWYRETLADLSSRASAECMAAIECAVDALPAALADADPRVAALEPWFLEHFHEPPVAHDTALYNAVRAAVDELGGRLADAQQPATSVHVTQPID